MADDVFDELSIALNISAGQITSRVLIFCLTSPNDPSHKFLVWTRVKNRRVKSLYVMTARKRDTRASRGSGFGPAVVAVQ